MHSSDFFELMGLIDNPPEGTSFYHYCSPETFLSICNGKKLRFSDMNSMNDFLEGSWGYELFIKLGNELLKRKEMTLECLDQLDLFLHESSYLNLRLICSLSKNGDVLSQWRSYANNASGYAIGFSAKNLLKMPIRILDVIYDEDIQYKNLSKILKTLNYIYNNKYEEEFNQLCNELHIALARFKNPAFKEEMEVRLIHIARLDTSDEKNQKYIFDNGYVDDDPVFYDIKYRMNSSVPTAYIDFDFCYKEENPILEVVLGPKNKAHPVGVKIAMSTMGIRDVNVVSSKASYR